MRIAVIGAGGVGGYFGGRLAQAGEDVTFVARGATLRALQTDGLHVEMPDSRIAVRPKATDDPASVGAVDLVVLGVKAWQVPEAARAARPLVGPSTMVLPLQNGVEAADQVAAELGLEHVLGGLCYVVAFVTAPGHVMSRPGVEPTVAFGELDNRASDRVRRVQEVFDRTGVKTIVPPDILAALWSKFLFIAAFGGVGAVTRAPIGVIREIPETRAMLEQAMHEVQTLAAARGVALPADAAIEAMRRLDGATPAATASMQRDIMEGRPSELESHSGAVIRLGAQAGIETPLHQFIYQSLLPSEKRARGEIVYPA